MSLPEHQTGQVRNGDVNLFYRLYGAPGALPILTMHGANYFDSYNWAGVAAGLSRDRQVASMDMRGFGESDWSASKDYSMNARIEDAAAIAADLGNGVPISGGRVPELNGADVWEELGKIECPVLVVRGTRSDRYTPDVLERMAVHENVTISEVDSEHDVPSQAPGELIQAVKEFLSN
jgi:pimeloyl-ACP methyl ester carboxylesterase